MLRTVFPRKPSSGLSTFRAQQGANGAQIHNTHGKPTEIIGKHACGCCGSELSANGHGKGKVTELKHTCNKCRSDSAFYCATKPGEGTIGMKKEKK